MEPWRKERPLNRTAGGVLVPGTVLLALALLSYFGSLPRFLEASSLAAAAMIFPGSALLALVGVRPGRVRDLLLAPVFSPLVLGFAVIVAFRTGADPGRVAGILTLVAGAAALFLALRRGPDRDEPAEPPPLAWGVGLLIAAAVAVILVASPWRRITSDAWFHTGVVFEMERGGVPPEDPYFAGLPLQYFWFFHTALLGLGRVSGLSPADGMALLNVVAAALLVPAAARVAGALGMSRAQGLWAGAILLLGMGGLFWLFLPVKMLLALVGETRGREALRIMFQLHATPESTAAFTQIFLSSGFVLRKFLVGTAASWGLLLIVTTAGAGLRFLDRAERRDAAVFFLGVLGAVLFHVVLGSASLAAFSAACGLAALLGRVPRGRGFALPVLALVAVALTVPYLRSVTSAKEAANVLPVGLNFVAILSLPFTLAGVAVVSIPALRRLARAGTASSRVYLGWLAFCVLYALVARLPGPNQFDKPPLAPYVPLAIAAGISVPMLWESLRSRPGLRRAFAVFLVLWIVPENAIQWSGFFAARHAPVEPAAETALYRWIGRETPRDAIFVDSDDRMDILVRGPRRQYWGIEAYAAQWGYPHEEMNRRRRVRDDLMRGAPDDDDIAALRALDAPVYVVIRDAEAPGARERLREDARFEEAYTGDGVSVFRLR